MLLCPACHPHFIPPLASRDCEEIPAGQSICGMHGYHVETRTISLMKGPLDQMKSRKQSRGDPTKQGDQALGMVCLTGPQTIVKLIKSVCGFPIPHGLYHLG